MLPMLRLHYGNLHGRHRPHYVLLYVLSRSCVLASLAVVSVAVALRCPSVVLSSSPLSERLSRSRWVCIWRGRLSLPCSPSGRRAKPSRPAAYRPRVMSVPPVLFCSCCSRVGSFVPPPLARSSHPRLPCRASLLLSLAVVLSCVVPRLSVSRVAGRVVADVLRSRGVARAGVTWSLCVCACAAVRRAGRCARGGGGGVRAWPRCVARGPVSLCRWAVQRAGGCAVCALHCSSPEQQLADGRASWRRQ